MAILRRIRQIRSVELTVNSPIHRERAGPGTGKMGRTRSLFAADGRHFSARHLRGTPPSRDRDGYLRDQRRAGTLRQQRRSRQARSRRRAMDDRRPGSHPQGGPAPGSTVHSLQLWINLPSTHKMIKPRYQNLRAEKMPVREEDGATIRVFSGSSKGVRAPTLKHRPGHDGGDQRGAGVHRLTGPAGPLQRLFATSWREKAGVFGAEEAEGKARGRSSFSAATSAASRPRSG